MHRRAACTAARQLLLAGRRRAYRMSVR